MPDAPNLAPPHQPAIRPLTGPLLLWLLIQVAALLLAAARVPLAAQYPAPAEMLAAHVVAVVQVTAAAVLAPYLLRDVAAFAAAVATVWPFLVLAGALSATSSTTLAVAAAYVTAWLVALSAANLALPAPSRHWTVAAATVLTTGAAALGYLNAEFGGAADHAWVRMLPPLAVLHQLDSGTTRWTDWVLPAAIATAAAARLMLRRRHAEVIHRS
jgi:hypothetical protein